jgi:hypothetical protein
LNYHAQAVSLPALKAERPWTQFLYQLPQAQLLAVMASQQNDTTYFMVVQAKASEVPALTPTFNNLLTGFKIM